MKAEGRVQNADLVAGRSFAQEGFHIENSFLSEAECEVLCEELSGLFAAEQCSKSKKIGGVRNLLRASDGVASLASSARVKLLLNDVAGGEYFPVRAIFFDKTEDNNWSVPWHQDLAIPVAGRIDTSGFSGWSVKDGVVHVHPPVEILESMVTLRLHLDECNGRNGALRVLPGSHLQGALAASEIGNWSRTREPAVCEVPKGGALLMRPLLLHSSSRADNPAHRRVLHLEFASRALPNGLNWWVC